VLFARACKTVGGSTRDARDVRTHVCIMRMAPQCSQHAAPGIHRNVSITLRHGWLETKLPLPRHLALAERVGLLGEQKTGRGGGQVLLGNHRVDGDHLGRPGSERPSAHEALGMCHVGRIEGRLACGKECLDTPAEHIGGRGEARAPHADGGP
jgi:hypothetical protein